MSIRGTVVRTRDLHDGDVTVTYELVPPAGRTGQQNVTVSMADAPTNLTCGDSIVVDYATQSRPKIYKENE